MRGALLILHRAHPNARDRRGKRPGAVPPHLARRRKCRMFSAVQVVDHTRAPVTVWATGHGMRQTQLNQNVLTAVLTFPTSGPAPAPS